MKSLVAEPLRILKQALRTACAVLCGLLAATFLTSNIFAATQQNMLVYIGTYTGHESKGIYAYRMDLASGKLEPLGLVAETTSPSFLAIHPSGRFIYAVNEVDKFQGKPSGAISAFSIQPDSGKLTLLNQQSSIGSGPCYLTVDKSGKYALAANYGSGSVCVLKINKDGSLGDSTAFIQHQGSSVNPDRQKEPHAHSINLDAANRFAIAADLGLDKLLVYRFDVKNGSLTPNDPPWTKLNPGSGPRHFAFHPNGSFGYIINEMQSTVDVLSYNAKQGSLSDIQTISTLPEGFKGNTSTAEVRVHPSGKFLYGSNRGHDSITIFTIDQKTGKLHYVKNEPTQGKTPRNFGIDPSGKYLIAANQDSNSLVVFRINPDSGELQPTGQKLDVGSPVCVKFLAVH